MRFEAYECINCKAVVFLANEDVRFDSFIPCPYCCFKNKEACELIPITFNFAPSDSVEGINEYK